MLSVVHLHLRLLEKYLAERLINVLLLNDSLPHGGYALVRLVCLSVCVYKL